MARRRMPKGPAAPAALTKGPPSLHALVTAATVAADRSKPHGARAESAALLVGLAHDLERDVLGALRSDGAGWSALARWYGITRQGIRRRADRLGVAPTAATDPPAS